MDFGCTMRSLRLAQKSFAAEAALLTDISDDTIQSWSTDHEQRRIVINRLIEELNAIHSTPKSPQKAAMTYDFFRYMLENLSHIACNRTLIEIQVTKMQHLMNQCNISMYEMYTNEEYQQFLRLSEFCKAYSVLCERILVLRD